MNVHHEDRVGHRMRRHQNQILHSLQTPTLPLMHVWYFFSFFFFFWVCLFFVWFWVCLINFHFFVQAYIYAFWRPHLHCWWKCLRDNVSISTLGFYWNLFIFDWIRWNYSWILGDGCRHIIPYIRKCAKHPVTGASLKQEDLIPLIFHKNH